MINKRLIYLFGVIAILLFTQVVVWALPSRVEWEYAMEKPKLYPGKVSVTSEGNILISRNGYDKPSVVELNDAGEIVWEYGPIQSNSAVRLENGNTLITDSGAPGYPFKPRVIEVNREGKILWSYEWNSRADAPFFADGLENGHVLVILPNRVLEITRQKEIIWSYEKDLLYPVRAERLPNGNTLIVDKGFYGGKVIEVNPAGEIIWQYGDTQFSNNPKKLIKPVHAQTLPDGSTIITDIGASAIIQVNGQESKKIFDWKNVLKSVSVLNQWDAISLPDNKLLWSLTLSNGSSVVWKIDDGVKTYLDDIWYEPQTQPLVKDNQVFLPAREFLTLAGMQVLWNADLKQLTVSGEGITVIMTLDEKEIFINGESIILTTPPQNQGGTLMVPLELMKKLGTDYAWDPSNKILNLYFPKSNTII